MEVGVGDEGVRWIEGLVERRGRGREGGRELKQLEGARRRWAVENGIEEVGWG